MAIDVRETTEVATYPSLVNSSLVVIPPRLITPPLLPLLGRPLLLTELFALLIDRPNLQTGLARSYLNSYDVVPYTSVKASHAPLSECGQKCHIT
jgi:hypothetical protein